MKKVSYLLWIALIVAFLLNGKLVFAQFEDDIIEEEKAEVVCLPDTMLTAYDRMDYGEVSFDDIRQAYSLGSEYYKNKNYKSA